MATAHRMGMGDLGTLLGPPVPITIAPKAQTEKVRHCASPCRVPGLVPRDLVGVQVPRAQLTPVLGGCTLGPIYTLCRAPSSKGIECKAVSTDDMQAGPSPGGPP